MEPPTEPDHYLVLGITQDATRARIRQAFLKLSLKYHPDKSKSNGAAADADKFRMVREVSRGTTGRGFSYSRTHRSKKPTMSSAPTDYARTTTPHTHASAPNGGSTTSGTTARQPPRPGTTQGKHHRPPLRCLSRVHIKPNHNVLNTRLTSPFQAPSPTTPTL